MPKQSTESDTLSRLPDPEGSYRFFPGWWMLGISAAAQFMSGPGQSYSVAAFKDAMRSELGISETSYSLAYGVATLLSGVSLPFVGRLVDHVGARRVLPVTAALLGVACWWMSYTTTLPGLYVGFSMIRCLGQGALTLISMWIVGEWFARRRGLATALAGIGGSLSVMTFPLLNNVLITQFNWHTAWATLGTMVWLGVIVPSLLFLRDRPEEMGLHPDGVSPDRETDVEKEAGERASKQAAGCEVLLTTHSWTVGEVLRDLTFWKLLCVPAAAGMIVTGLTFHQVAVLAARDVPAVWALALISFQAIVATLFSIPAGWLTDRVASRRLLSLAMLFLAGASLIILVMPSPHLAVLYASLLGLHGAILRSTGNVVWLNYYGRTHQGGVRGVAMSAMILAAAIGPLPFAFSIDQFGSYRSALLFFIAVPLAAAAIVSTARPPRPPSGMRK